MTEDAAYVGVDVPKSTLDVAVSSSEETRQFANDHEGTSQAVRRINSLKPAGIMVEATGHLEMPLAAALQDSAASGHRQSFVLTESSPFAKMPLF